MYLCPKTRDPHSKRVASDLVKLSKVALLIWSNMAR